MYIPNAMHPALVRFTIWLSLSRRLDQIIVMSFPHPRGPLSGGCSLVHSAPLIPATVLEQQLRRLARTGVTPGRILGDWGVQVVHREQLALALRVQREVTPEAIPEVSRRIFQTCGECQ